jgi:hypothetical protein
MPINSHNFLWRINNMDYKLVEMSEDIIKFTKYERIKEEFITSFQNEVKRFLNNGYTLAGGISIAVIGQGSIHFAQALIK